ncbi:electron transfer flavoprotein subunit alpha/FixB family protein [Corynebacterium pseudodiphtheriticum]|uniref:electron transfer flavoprotein subunit alpha/FixB family protein n=1 Tax=Corynebacterium pseudodiphtheriticum TaxID=37637 RepID=UPI000F87DF95|nr:electron transfer flavoprotein subunit alpha/FixB family protein [Corynebacterium pseudodiphtheriticum]MDK4304925.1 electron transfer flavoprotein subunit alpha/FixB family protein [Corynebacterium pseudodiphtheriticum]MDK8683239.1 electron transfer flavoprotein subunit alpha/FixB family protein [Corynebacterium pseudodiphtheriticum]MDK8805594.1 electron transfer flavoprotein subunit alpha/FixB family protein [Corynebacterium pseudodiphtheriticum]RUP91195.1 electron transfer flavoprotein sub
MAHVYVLIEHENGQLNPVSKELIAAARPLGSVHAVVVSAPGGCEQLPAELASAGVDKIYSAEVADYEQRLVLPEVDALSTVAASNPGPIMVAAGTAGNEIVGRLGARLASGILSDVVGINANGTAQHSIFGGSVDVVAQAEGDCPLYSLRPGAVEPEANPVQGAGNLEKIVLGGAAENEARVVSFTPAVKGDRPDLLQAKNVVAGGRGVGSAENFADVIEPLADSLGAAVGATRDAVDDGMYAPAHQIGQTGVTVSPKLYIGLGISGAIQHLAGMQTAEHIIVVNQDADEPFFAVADLGVVGDLHEIAPALTAELRARAQS